jgi:hypothetical protein
VEPALAHTEPGPWGGLALALGIVLLLAQLLPFVPRARAALGLGAFLSLASLIFLRPDWVSGKRAFDIERHGAATLRYLEISSRNFRDNDFDGNGVKDYWRSDIAGLYANRESDPYGLSIALADERPTSDLKDYGTRAPNRGYGYRALRFADEKSPAPDRWAACAVPQDPDHCTFLVTHDGLMYRKQGRHALDVVPPDPDLKRDWIFMPTR